MGRPADERRAQFEEWIQPLLGHAMAYAYALVRNRADSEDALQDALLKGYLGLAGYDPARSFKGWWFTIVHNCCRDLARRRRARRFFMSWFPVRENAKSDNSIPGGDVKAYSCPPVTDLPTRLAIGVHSPSIAVWRAARERQRGSQMNKERFRVDRLGQAGMGAAVHGTGLGCRTGISRDDDDRNL